MRLGGPVFEFDSPAEWIAALQRSGYRAAYCPVGVSAESTTIRAYASAAKAADVVIAEVGAWSNPLAPDSTTRLAALDTCKRSLALAEQIGARCCVNIAGSRGAKWDGPDAKDLTAETFDIVVATVKEIIDAVQPSQTFYALETMPWMYPDSPDSYLELIEAIDRPGFAVHLDPVNMINGPQRFFRNSAFIKECIAKLGPYIQSCHAKDVAFGGGFITHLDEVRPGLGSLDYATFLRELDHLDPDVPLMLEHLPSEQEYRLAAEYVRAVAGAIGVDL